MTVYLIRHGQSATNLAAQFTGQLDVPLSELGQQQARKIGEYFLGVHIDKIYSSDLSRAVDTVALLSKTHRVPLETAKEFREIYAGQWQGMKFDDIKSSYPKEYAVWMNDIGNCICTKGESVQELLHRVLGKLREIAASHQEETVVIATHATPIRVLLAYLRDGNLSNMCRVPWVPNASVTKLSYENGIFTPVQIGDVSHLEGMLTNLTGNV